METPERKPTHSEIISQLELLIDDLQDKLVHHAYFRLGNKADAEDVVQDVMITLWNKRNEISRLLNIEAYAMQSVKNVVKGFRRKIATTRLSGPGMI